MAFDKQKLEAIASLAETLKELTGTTVENLVRAAGLGTEFNFSRGEQLFNLTITLMRRLMDSRYDILPTPTIHELMHACASIHNEFQAIRNFHPAQENAQSVRDSLIDSLGTILSNYLPLFTSAIAVTGQDDASLRRRMDEVNEIVRSTEALKKRADTNVKDAERRSKDILDKLQKMGSSAAVKSHARHFQEEARTYRMRSRWWLVVTIALAGIAACISFGAVNETVSSDSDWVSVVQSIVGRFSLMALAYFMVIWASRMYRAACHNEVINRHRVNALATFETFTSAARDDTAKDAVLMRATECIFSHQASGFSDSKPETGSTRIFSASPATLSGPQATPAPGGPGDTTP